MFTNNIMTILVGNSDNKLSQQEWSEFIMELNMLCRTLVSTDREIHFMGGSNSEDRVQNYAIVISTKNIMFNLNSFYKDLQDLRSKYLQDSIAVVEGKTKFI